MPRRVFDFDAPDRVVSGTVGEPGNRTFYLQVRQGRAVLSVALEKVQVAVLAGRISVLLDELRTAGATADEAHGPWVEDHAPLDEPVIGLFRVGALVLSWDTERESVIIEAHAAPADRPASDGSDSRAASSDPPARVEAVGATDPAGAASDADDEAEVDVLRARLSVPMARGFVSRAARVVAAGRPTCPLCGLPLDPGGHICPRSNGQIH